MRSSPPIVTTLVEIGRGANGDVPATLVTAAYRASRSRHVMLVLDAITPVEVDDLLDAVVGRYGHMHRGLVYATLNDERSVLRAAARADHVFAGSEAFCSRLTAEGIPYLAIALAEPALQHEAAASEHAVAITSAA